MTRIRRHGLTLIELNVLIGVASVVIATLGVVLHTMMQISQGQQADIEELRIMSRLDLELRDDVQQAAVVEFQEKLRDGVASNTSVRMQLPDGSELLYECDNEVVHRTATRGETMLGRDAFRLGKNSQARFEVTDTRRGMTKVVLRIERFDRRDPENTVPRYVHRLVAVQRTADVPVGGPPQ